MEMSAANRRQPPIRMCVICRTKDVKRTMTRIVRLPDGAIAVDLTGKRNGRGAYLCDDPACWRRAAESNVLGAALRIVLTDDARAVIRSHSPAQ
ncbi:MAG: YlxR family protein [Chloroflexi bacterium]|nr:YlxR family protein [Chloroflexota bacterium]MBW7879536.1 YlxR family protein [Anaerolineae bacterium]MDL1917658.1 YlxR family protein [Anaerolineae bacterium CFX4]MCC6564558.1 YlxR family protein [Chloroflexota bacterium]MCO6445039.1 YlxR family protein [Anaerolineae bacterium]